MDIAKYFHFYLDVDERFDESGEINFSMKSQLKYVALIYSITVPRGYVKLTVHGESMPPMISLKFIPHS